MRKYMSSLISAFLSGEDYAYAATAHFNGDKFYSYNTVICLRKDGVYYLTLDKFSRTTTQQQNALRDSIPSKDLRIVSVGELQELLQAL